MYRLLVFEGGMPPGYVLCEMPFWEINIAIEGVYMRHKESWEQTRWLGWVIAACAGNKAKPADLMKFPWETEKRAEKDPEATRVTDEDIERLTRKAAEYVKSLKDK